MKRVLIITYYWPPAGGSGVQRWLKFAKYLPHNGWQPVIYCPENPDYTVLDESLAKDIPSEAEVIKGAIFEPYRFFRKITGQKEVIGTGLSSTGGKAKSTSLLKKFMIWVRGNMIIPDARMFWIKPSVKRLRKYIEENPVDAIVSTGPPHSCHLIALGLKKHFPDIKWIADFRDPWSEIFYIDDLQMSKSILQKIKKLEKLCLDKSDSRVVVTASMKSDFEKLTKEHISIITNGYDAEDYKRLKKHTIKNKFIISYIGTLMPTQYSSNLWKSIYDIIKINSEIEIEVRLIGSIDLEIYNKICDIGLKNNMKHYPYLKHAEIAQYQVDSDVLLLFVNNTINGKAILTGKLFEYIASKKTILCVAPDNSDAAKIIDETQSGEVFNYDDRKGMTAFIKKCMENKAAGKAYNNIGISAYTRHHLTIKLAELLNQP